MVTPKFALEVYNRVEGAKDSLGRPTFTYALADSPLPVLAVAPMELEETETQTVSAETESLVLYLPKGVTLSTDAQVSWRGYRWDVTEVKSYDFGPWSLGGSTARIDRRLAIG